MTYLNLTNITQGNSTLQIITTINTELTYGMFGLFVLIAIFIILFVNMDQGSAKETFSIVTFITSIVAALFWISGIIPLYFVFVPLVLAFIGIVLLILLD